MTDAAARVCDVLCIGAHPDDVEIGMGGTVAGMTARGLRVGIVDITDGEPTPYGSREKRALEAAEAARILGVEHRRCLGGENRFLAESRELRVALARIIREWRPTLLFVPYETDAHPDHIAAHALAIAARFTAKLTKTDMSGEPHWVPRIHSYAAVHRRMAPEPSFLVDVSETLGTKLEALGAYRSQFLDNPGNSALIEVIERRARFYGDLAGVYAAEPFFAYEPLVVPEIERLR